MVTQLHRRADSIRHLGLSAALLLESQSATVSIRPNNFYNLSDIEARSS